MKFIILRALLESIKPTDSYAEAEAKARRIMGRLKDSNQITEWGLTSDPNGPDVAIIWVESGKRSFQKLRLDLKKKIDEEILSVMEILES